MLFRNSVASRLLDLTERRFVWGVVVGFGLCAAILYAATFSPRVTVVNEAQHAPALRATLTYAQKYCPFGEPATTRITPDLNANRTKRVFIDLGAYNGDTIMAFMKLVPNAAEYDMYAFECEPKNLKALRDNLKEYETRCGKLYNTIEVIPACAGTENKIMSLYRDGVSGRLVEPGANSGVEVQVIDFAGWLLTKTSIEHFVVLKMDIEGAEFDLLARLVDVGAIEFVDKLQLETHAWKDVAKKEAESIILRDLEEEGLKYRYASKHVAKKIAKFTSWRQPHKYINPEDYPRPWVDRHFTRDGIAWETDW